MKKEEIKSFLKPLTKKDLRKVIEVAEEQLNSSLGIGDYVTLTIEYMIGDANGYTEESCGINISSQNELDALEVVQDILDNYTSPNEGTWGFILDEKSFSIKSKEIYNILFNQEEAPKKYKDIELNEVILETISHIVEECFRSDTEYSFLVYQSYTLEQ